MADQFLNATERLIVRDGKEIPQVMPAFVRNGEVYRLPAEQNGVKVLVMRPVYDIASKQRNDLEIVE